jgi:hypothetical protein
VRLPFTAAISRLNNLIHIVITICPGAPPFGWDFPWSKPVAQVTGKAEDMGNTTSRTITCRRIESRIYRAPAKTPSIQCRSHNGRD